MPALKMRSSTLFFRISVILFWVALIFGVLFHSNFIPEKKTEHKALHIFAWSNVIHPEMTKAFEDRYGIKVILDYYSSNEELLVKLKATKGAGYDLIVPSDYAVKLMVEDGLLKPLDKSKLTFLKDINPFLLGHDHDPENIYSLPLQWDLTGFVIDTDIVKHPKDAFTWGHIFDPALIKYKLAMTNDPVEAFCAASFYLFGDKEKLTKRDAQKIKELLTEQKQHIEAYAVPRSDFFVTSKNAALAFSLSGYALKAKKDFPHIEFAVPLQGSFISIENIAIPSGSQHNDDLYTFINFLFEPENQVDPCNKYGGFPANLNAIALLNYKADYEEIVKIIGQEGYKLHFLRHLISDEEMRVLWVDIKS